MGQSGEQKPRLSLPGARPQERGARRRETGPRLTRRPHSSLPWGVWVLTQEAAVPTWLQVAVTGGG